MLHNFTLFLLAFYMSGSNSIPRVAESDSATPSSQDRCRIIKNNVNFSDDEMNLAFQLSMLSGLSYADWSKKTVTMKKSVTFEMHTQETSATGMIVGFIKRAKCVFASKVSDIWQHVRLTTAHFNNTISPKKFNNQSRAQNSSVSSIISNSHQITSSRSLVKSSCPPASFSRVTFQHLWFFNGWTENGVWHDTEVLVSAHAGSVAIVFRGSESVADLMTSSQRLEPARRRGHFRNITRGSVHRGIFNAFHKVNQGEIVPLGGGDDVTESRDGDNGRVDSYIRDAYRDCLLSSANKTHVKGGEEVTKKKKSCFASNALLKSLLLQTATKALHAGKQVYLTGHSLGGALATFMALDLLINLNESTQFLDEETPEDLRQYDDNDNDPGSTVDKRNDFLFRRASCTSKDSLGEQPQSGKRHDDRGTTKDHTAAHDSLFNNLHLYTFGEPEIADNYFYHNIFSSHTHIAQFVKLRYRRFVGLSKTPSCKADVVTTLAARIARVIGESAMGGEGGRRMESKNPQRGGFWRTSIAKSSHPSNSIIKQQTQTQSQTQSQSQEDTGPEWPVHVSGVLASSSSPATNITQAVDVAVASAATTGINSFWPSSDLLAQLYNRLTEVTIHLAAGSPAVINDSACTSPLTPFDTMRESGEARISFVVPPYYVCSGGATSMLQAHRIQHYVRGIIHRKDEDAEVSSTTSTTTSRSSSGARAGQGGWGRYLLRHDVSLQDAQEVDMADECFHAMDNEFFTYSC